MKGITKIRVPVAPVGSRHVSKKDYDRRQNSVAAEEDFCIDFCEKSVCPPNCRGNLLKGD